MINPWEDANSFYRYLVVETADVYLPWSNLAAVWMCQEEGVKLNIPLTLSRCVEGITGAWKQPSHL